MALSPITQLPVKWENVFVDIQPTSLFGMDHDIAMIHTTMLLRAAEAEQVVFALPAIDTPESAPILRVFGKTAGTAAEFKETTFDHVEEELREAFAQAPRGDMDLFNEMKAEVENISLARIRIEPGDQLVRLDYAQHVPQLEDGAFEFRIIAPLASLLLNPVDVEIAFAVALPWAPGRTLQVVAAHSENPPGTPATPLSQRTTIAQRKYVGSLLRRDPVYSVEYRYGQKGPLVASG